MRQLTEQWRLWSKQIGEAAREILGECSVYVFGSVAKGEYIGGSDVDILIVSNKLPSSGKSRCEIKALIEEKANLPPYHPFEIHLATSIEAEENPIHSKAVKEGLKIL